MGWLPTIEEMYIRVFMTFLVPLNIHRSGNILIYTVVNSFHYDTTLSGKGTVKLKLFLVVRKL